MSTKHTPGPWKQYGLAVRAGTRNVCSNVNAARGGLNITEQVDVASANARLISAAPELLEALQGLVRINEQHNQSFIEVIGKPLNWKDDYLDAARAAIKKATGEEA